MGDGQGSRDKSVTVGVDYRFGRRLKRNRSRVGYKLLWTGWELKAFAGVESNGLVSICAPAESDGEKRNIITGSHCHRKRTRLIAERAHLVEQQFIE